MIYKRNSFRILTVTLFFLCLFPFHSFAAEKQEPIYSIQLASHRDVNAARKEFDHLTKTLNKESLDYLRIEKIGKYYSLRLGKFKDRSGAEKLLSSIKPHISSYRIMAVNYIKKRIVKMYEPQEQVEEVRIQQPPVTEKVISEEAGEAKRPPGEIADQKTDVPIEDKLASISSLVHNKNYASALTVIEKEIAEHPQHPALNAWYGTVLVKADKPEEALPYLEKAVELSPREPDYYNSLGYCLFYLDKTESAVRAFDKVLSLEPGHIDALSGLGIIFAKRGDKDKGMDIYNKLKALDEASANKLLKLLE